MQNSVSITPIPTSISIPQSLSNEALDAEINTLNASITVATWRLLTLIAELDRRGLWAAWGLLSCAHWLNWRCGIALGAAREKVRVARALQSLPAINAAFASGAVSYSKVRAMTRVATPENQDYLLRVARHGTASHMERLVGGFCKTKRLQQSAEANRGEAQRAVRWWYDDDGSMHIDVKLPAEQGTLVLKAIDAAVADLRRERDGVDRPEAEREGLAAVKREVDAEALAEFPAAHLRPSRDSFDPAEYPARAWRADGVCHLAEQFLAHGAGPSQRAERYQVVVHVDQSQLQTDPPQCRIEDGPAIAAETARRIACDAAIVTIDDDESGNVLDIGRRTRAIPPAIRRALQSRDQGCRFPGCMNHRYVDAHHIRHWADGGETSLRNLVLLCRPHHRLLHEGGFTLQPRDDNRLLFFRPDGLLVPDAPAAMAQPTAIAMILDEYGIDVSAETSVGRWDGQPVDMCALVGGLLDVSDRVGVGVG